MRNDSDQVAEEIKTQILSSFLNRKSCCLWDNVGKYGTARKTGHKWQYDKVHALCLLDK